MLNSNQILLPHDFFSHGSEKKFVALPMQAQQLGRSYPGASKNKIDVSDYTTVVCW